jgi:parvulin-like peptidyl-prolyl isomerase
MLRGEGGQPPFPILKNVARSKRVAIMKTILKLAVWLALSALIAAAQLASSHAPTIPATAPATVPTLSTPVVKVNGTVLTELDLREQMQRIFPYYSIHGGKVPDKYLPEIRQQAMDRIVAEELIYQEAKHRGMHVPPEVMAKVFRTAKARFGSPQAYQDYAKALYGSVAEFERRIRRATLIEQFEHQEIELKSRAPEARLREIYDKNKASFLRPESVSLQSISVNLPQNASEEQKKLARQRIEEILPQARAAKNYTEFGLLAEKVSEDDYRVDMGDHKWVHIVGTPPEIAKAVTGMKPGDTSDIIEAPVGYIILRLNDYRPPKQMTYDEVKAEIRKQVDTAAAQQRWAALQKQLKQNAHIENL